MEEELEQECFWKNFLIGGTSAAIADTICAPIERVKLLLQTQHVNDGLHKIGKYKGIFDCFVQTIKHEGVVALWRGNLTNLYRNFPTIALTMAFSDRIRQKVCPYDLKEQTFKYICGTLLAGGLGGNISLLIVYPLDFARTRLSVDIGKSKDHRQFTGIRDILSKVVKKEGIRGIYQGLMISSFGMFFYRGAHLGLFDITKQIIMP